MPCARHGRVCVEPPTVFYCPSNGTCYMVRRQLGKGGFARVYYVVRLPPNHPFATNSQNSPSSNDSNEKSIQPPILPQPPPPLPPPVHDPEQKNSFHSNPDHFALKVISKCRINESKISRDALLSEVSVHRQAQHPAIVPLIAYWEDAHRIYLLMKLVDGPTLEQHLSTRHRLNESEACVYAAQILEALSYLHSNRIVHKDIKLANLILSSDLTRIHLCDFGLSAFIDPTSHIHYSPVCGTPNYVAPELLTAQMGTSTSTRLGRKRSSTPSLDRRVPYTPSVDIWSTGVVLFMMLVGSGPFDSDRGADATFRRIRTARFTFPIGLKLSIACKSLIRALLAEDPSQRPTADQALRHTFFAMSPSISSPHQQIFDTRTHVACNSDQLPTGAPNGISYRRSNARRGRELELERQPVAHADRSSSQERHRPITAHGERWQGEERSAVRPKYDRAASLTHSHTSRRRTGARDRSRVLSSHGQGPTSRKASTAATGLRKELINLSVGLSAALVKGRKYMEDQQLAMAKGSRERKALSVLTDVDGIKEAPPLVRRWLDYTGKYGFATLMEDGHVGCCFNDGSIMFVVSNETVPDVAYIAPLPTHEATTIAEQDNEVNDQQTSDVPKKACLCTLFADMMIDGRRGSVHDFPSTCNVSFLQPDEDSDSLIVREHEKLDKTERRGNLTQVNGNKHKHVVYVREWARLRHGKAAAFRLSNHSVHVKFDVGDESHRDDCTYRCDDFVFDLKRSTVFYRQAKSKTAQMCNLNELGEFSSLSEYIYAQLVICAQAVMHFLE